MKQLNMGGLIPCSAIALGCMRMREDHVIPIMEAALACGIDWFDHADIYGGGSAESAFGAYLKAHPSLRDNIKIQTKCAIHDGQYDFSKEHLLSSVEDSLRRLCTDHIDVLLLHRPDTLMEPEEVAEAFDLLERSGKVLHFGVSNQNPYQMGLLKTAVRQPLIANQLQVSLTEAGIFSSGMNVNMKNACSVMHDGGILEYCRIHRVTIQAWSPLQYGFFEGNFVGDSQHFPELNKVLDELAEKYSVSPSAIAVAWLLRHPANLQVITGTMTPAHLKELCAGADISLSRAEWYALYRAAGHTLP